MIVELADVSQTIILRAAIVAGLGFALVMILAVGIVAGAVYWFTERRRVSPEVDGRIDVQEYDEAA